MNLKQKSQPWMRPVSFTVLLHILRFVSDHPFGLKAGELDAAIRDQALLLTQQGLSPSRTTLYHYRNTLLKLGALKREGNRLLADVGNPQVESLLDQPNSIGSELNAVSRRAFAELVLQNTDCKVRFFDLFVPEELVDNYDSQQFRTLGRSVIWRRAEEARPAEVSFYRDWDERRLSLRSPSETKGVLYGLRYWARDELKLVDEFFREDRGSIMYPILDPAYSPSPQEVVVEIFGLLDEEKEWTTLSLRELIAYCCEERRRPLESLFTAIRLLETEYSRYVVLVPTSRSFATLTAQSRPREEFELRGYFRDTKGRYVSHIRIHNSVGRWNNATAS